MNIIQVISCRRTSGTASMVIVLGDWLKRRGHQVLTVCPPGSWLTGRLREMDLPVVEVAMHGLNAPSAVFKLRNLVCEHRTDIIHTHLTRAAYIGHLAGRMAHVPVISTVHVFQRNPAYRYLPNRDRSVVAVSDYLRQNLIATGVPVERVQTIYNGTDFAFDEQSLPASDNAVRAELGLPADATLIGMFGQINAFKGSSLLVEAARAILKRFPGAYFVFVGAAKPAFQQELIQLAQTHGVLDHLRFTGVRSDVQRIMAAMDVITLPSRYEMCSMAIIEAMAVGKPVVATRAGGNPELVQDGETGLLIERTTEALANALISMLEDAQARKRMGEAAQRVAKTRFSASVMVSQIEALYNELVGAGTLMNSSVPTCE
jgi:glycosyltransferase involved in cell wall biosynthesis